MMMEVYYKLHLILYCLFLHMVNNFRCLFVAQPLYVVDYQHKQHSVSEIKHLSLSFLFAYQWLHEQKPVFLLNYPAASLRGIS